jgi:hypothetical protein
MRVKWDENSDYSLGVSSGVLYPQNSSGVSWNGLISVTDNGDTAPTALYLDGQKVGDRTVPSTFAGTISAFMYPEEFEPCIGMVSGISSQPRQLFSFTYRSNNELHLVYNALVDPGSDDYTSIAASSTAVTFSWAFTTLPIDIPAGRPSAHLVIMLDYAQPEAVSALEDIIYGDAVNDASMPDPDTILEIFESYTTLRITDNGDGTWTATGPDDVVYLTSGIDGWLQTLLDDFGSGSLDGTKWYEADGSAGISVSSGKLRINAVNSYPMVEYSNADFDLSSGILAAKLYQSGTAAAGTYMFLGAQDEVGNAVYIVCQVYDSTAYNISAWGDTDLEDIVQVETDVFGPSWTAGTWMGIGNLASEVVYFYTSSDGQTWTEIGHATIASGFDATQSRIFFMTGLDSGTTDWTLLVDDPSKWQPGEILSDEFTINWPSAVFIDADSYRVFSL